MSLETAAVFLAAMIAALLLVLVLRRGGGAVDAERLRGLEAELAQLREAKAEAERRLAAEERTAQRVDGLERELGERTAQLESLREARNLAEIALARATEQAGNAAESLDLAQRRIAELDSAGRETAARLESLQARLAEATALQQEKAAAADRLDQELAVERRLHATVREEAKAFPPTRAAAAPRLEQEMAKAAEKLALLTEAREAMTNEFKVLAEGVMARHGEAFTKQNKEQVEGILNPLRDKLVEFQAGLATAHTETAKERATLAEQIRSLGEASARMTSETHNLTLALKGKAQTQGAWGEMILATILDRSGLREGDEYVKQQSHTGEAGERLRPDVIVNLPGGQRVVIDAKVSLTAFEEHVNAADEIASRAALGRHLLSLKTHIRTLGAKEYQSAIGSGLDYVIMFVPIEGALAAALREQPDLTLEATRANVAIATPTTLMMALRTIANVWSVERRNRNAEAIAERAGKLYDKFLGFVGDLQVLGGSLDRAKGNFDEAMGKLSTGRGNIIRQVETLKDLGARTNKTMPAVLLETAVPEALPANDAAAE